MGYTANIMAKMVEHLETMQHDYGKIISMLQEDADNVTKAVLDLSNRGFQGNMAASLSSMTQNYNDLLQGKALGRLQRLAYFCQKYRQAIENACQEFDRWYLIGASEYIDYVFAHYSFGDIPGSLPHAVGVVNEMLSVASSAYRQQYLIDHPQIPASMTYEIDDEITTAGRHLTRWAGELDDAFNQWQRDLSNIGNMDISAFSYMNNQGQLATLKFNGAYGGMGKTVPFGIGLSSTFALREDGTLVPEAITFNGNGEVIGTADNPFAFASIFLASDLTVASDGQLSDPPPRGGVAAMQSITRSVLDQPIDQPATLTVLWVDGDNPNDIWTGVIYPLVFRVRSGMSYTIDVPTNTPIQRPPPYVLYPPGTLPAVYPPAVIHDIVHWVDIIDGNANAQPVSFSIASSVDVYSGNGVYLGTAVGSSAGIIHVSSATDRQINMIDPTRRTTTVPFPPPPGGQDPTVLFILQHNVYIGADAISANLTAPSPPYIHPVSAFSPYDAGPPSQGNGP